MKVVHHHNPDLANELHRKATVNTLVAAGLTFAAVLALWALLLPQAFRATMPTTKLPTWLRAESDSNSTFGQALLQAQAGLDDLQAQIDDGQKRDKATSEAEKFRQTIGEAPATQNPAEPKTP